VHLIIGGRVTTTRTLLDFNSIGESRYKGTLLQSGVNLTLKRNIRVGKCEGNYVEQGKRIVALSRRGRSKRKRNRLFESQYRL
jgi:hypothetical protein